MIKKRTRKELYDKFRQGAIPSGADFADFIKSQLNLLDDGIDIPEDEDAPITLRAAGDKENFLDFSDAKGRKRWRISGRNENEEKEGLHFTADGRSRLYLERETGNIGAGTDLPLAKLHIKQTNPMDALRIDDEEMDETPFIVTSTGKVGIGIGNGDERPSAKLHIHSPDVGDAFRIDDALEDTTPLVVDAAGNVGIGTGSPKAKLTVIGGGISVGSNEAPPADGIFVKGDLAIEGNLVLKGGDGKAALEVDGSIKATTENLYIIDNVYIKADPEGQAGSRGDLFVEGNTVLGTYNDVPANYNVVTIHGKIRSGGDPKESKEQYELDVNETLTINRNPAAPLATIKGDLTVLGTNTLGNNLDNDFIFLNGIVQRGGDLDVTIDDHVIVGLPGNEYTLTVNGATSLGEGRGHAINLYGTIQTDVVVGSNHGLDVTGAVTLGSGGDDDIKLNGTIQTDVVIGSNHDLDVSGAVTLGSNSDDDIKLNGTIQTDVVVGSNHALDVTGAVTLGSNSDDDIKVNGTIKTNVVMNNDLTVKGSTRLGIDDTDDIYLNGTVKTQDNLLNIIGSASLTQNMTVNGSLRLDAAGQWVNKIVTSINDTDHTALPTEAAVKNYADSIKSLIPNKNYYFDMRQAIARTYSHTTRTTVTKRYWDWGSWSYKTDKHSYTTDHYHRYINIYPPAGYRMSHLQFFSASIGRIAFSGDVDGNDTIVCNATKYSSYIRCEVQNSEQRDYATINFFALWVK